MGIDFHDARMLKTGALQPQGLPARACAEFERISCHDDQVPRFWVPIQLLKRGYHHKNKKGTDISYYATFQVFTILPILPA